MIANGRSAQYRQSSAAGATQPGHRSGLRGASDEDRVSVMMFYYGYLAARAGIHIIDVSRIDDNIAKAMRQCAAAPNLTVPRVFREAPRLPAHG
jgi:hypothetical protein